jgi:MFS family permease
VVGFIGARHDHRHLLVAAAGLMMATGTALSMFDSYAILLVIAFAGSVNPSGGSASSFVPIEHAVLSRETSGRARTRMFARYGFIGAISSAAGAMAAAIPDFLTHVGLSEPAAIKSMFVVYAAFGLIGAVLYARMPKRPPAMRLAAKAALGLHDKLFTSSRRFSASTPSQAVLSSDRLWRFGCSHASICRSRRRACFSFGPASSRLSRFRSPRSCPSVSDWSTQWCSRTCHRAYA